MAYKIIKKLKAIRNNVNIKLNNLRKYMQYFLNTYVVLEIDNVSELRNNNHLQTLKTMFSNLEYFDIVSDSRGRFGLAYQSRSVLNPFHCFHSEEDVDILNDFYESEAFSFVESLSNRLSLLLGNVFVCREVFNSEVERPILTKCDFIKKFELPPL